MTEEHRGATVGLCGQTSPAAPLLPHGSAAAAAVVYCRLEFRSLAPVDSALNQREEMVWKLRC